MYFEWMDEYSVNVAAIDKQHRKMFEIGEKIYNLVLLKDRFGNYDKIAEIFEELKLYTLYHFEFEEKLMEKCNFKDIESHRLEHVFMIKKLQRIEKKGIDSNQKEATVDLITFVSDWIAEHILKTDMRYKPFLAEKGVK